jgi:hypothetical protein
MARVDVGQLKTYPRAAVDYGQAKIDGLYARTRGVVPDALACCLFHLPVCSSIDNDGLNAQFKPRTRTSMSYLPRAIDEPAFLVGREPP